MPRNPPPQKIKCSEHLASAWDKMSALHDYSAMRKYIVQGPWYPDGGVPVPTPMHLPGPASINIRLPEWLWPDTLRDIAESRAANALTHSTPTDLVRLVIQRGLFARREQLKLSPAEVAATQQSDVFTASGEDACLTEMGLLTRKQQVDLEQTLYFEWRAQLIQSVHPTSPTPLGVLAKEADKYFGTRNHPDRCLTMSLIAQRAGAVGLDREALKKAVTNFLLDRIANRLPPFSFYG